MRPIANHCVERDRGSPSRGPRIRTRALHSSFPQRRCRSRSRRSWWRSFLVYSFREPLAELSPCLGDTPFDGANGNTEHESNFLVCVFSGRGEEQRVTQGRRKPRNLLARAL